MQQQGKLENPHLKYVEELKIGEKSYKYFSLKALKDERVKFLPFSIRILLEQSLRNCDNFSVKEDDVEKILSWEQSSKQDIEIAFKPARVILQDLTGVPLVVDLAAMRAATDLLGKNPELINPLCPVDLVIDHSVQVDYFGSANSRDKNEEVEFERNKERFQFLKWGQKAFKNFSITPPGSGIVHQVNLEHIARVVFETNGFVYPDSVVGTDSHTTMINGLGVLGWGVGGIEAEANMLGETTSMVIPQVVGFKLTGQLNSISTATDLVLTCTEMLRKLKVVGKFVEFYGPGVSTLSLADRATISNMSPEYGATMGFFPVDQRTVEYLKQTGRTEEQLNIVQEYLKAQDLFAEDQTWGDSVKWSDKIELDLSKVRPCLAGPKRPQDRIDLSKMKEEFTQGLTAQVSFKGYEIAQDKVGTEVKINHENKEYTLKHGSILIASITSCTNTSNPTVMLSAGLLAKKAVEKGLSVLPYIKTSLSPGSLVVTAYYDASGLTKYLDQLNFNLAGYGCMTCIGNSGPLSEDITNAVTSADLVAAAVLSGNRNFEGRIHPLTRANYLASPPLVVAYALAGRVDIDFETEPLGFDQENKPVFLKDIWPSSEEVKQIEDSVVNGEMFVKIYKKIQEGTERWNQMNVEESLLYKWNEDSTYINRPPYFNGLKFELSEFQQIKEASCLALFGDSITTDHISPAGNIAANSPAGRYLQSRGVDKKDFNTYGARRGHDEVMVRGTFANVRIKNKMLKGIEAPHTIYVPEKKQMSIYDAASLYMKDNVPLVIIGGAEYGSGSSRDWAAKGPYLQGVKAVIVVSFERIHRSNLAGMGILPLEFKQNESASTFGLTGFEKFTVELKQEDLKVNQTVPITVHKEDGSTMQFQTTLRLDTDVEIQYYLHGGVLQYVLRKILSAKKE